MKELWIDAYEEVFDEFDGNATEEEIIARTEERFKERLADMVEARMLQMEGRLQ